MKIKETKIFRKEAKKAFKSGKDLNKLYEVVKSLSCKQILEPKYRDHALKGNWKESRECHIESDWLLIYTFRDNCLILERLGSHSELFN